MAELITLARPYAKAVFDAAKEQDVVDFWDQALALAGLIAANKAVKNILANPGLSERRKAELFFDTAEERFPEALRNFLLILAENKRLALLPEISTMFAFYRAELERTVKVKVSTAYEMTSEEQRQLAQALSSKLERKVALETAVDRSLIGGVVVNSGDLVIDASVRGKLAKMAKALGAPGFSKRFEDKGMQQLNPSEISDIIKKRIAKLDISSEEKNEGTILSVADGIVLIHGLADVMSGEMIEFANGTYGIALNLERDSVGAVVLGEYEDLAEGQKVRCTGRILEVPVGPELLGRVVDGLGNPIDGKGELGTSLTDAVEKIAPGVIERQSVDQPIQTGMKAIDTMVPVGRGQRELIIGDRQIGKTAVAIDAIINQKNSGIKCIYVAIGQKQSSIAAIVRKLEEHGAMDHTIVVAAGAADPAAMQFLAPYSGTTMGEYFRDRGEDALIVYDDLSKQAVAYRQISLLLRRPPGREAYPGDVFYLHSRLLERASRVNVDYVEKFTNGEVKGKTGSLTALPIIETQAGDVSAFVPTNVISITDGQIFLETNLFNSGIRPAMNAGISVSRVGGAAQTKIMKKLGGNIRLALAQYRELAAFAQFASDLDEATRNQLEHGQRVTELMKQNQYSPMSVAEMGTVLYAANEGFLDDIDVTKVVEFEAQLLGWMRVEQKDLLEKIGAAGNYNDDVAAGLKAALEKFKTTQTW